MKLAFPELTWLEPPSRGKLINELRHGGQSTRSRFFCPNLVGAPPQQVSAARLLAGYDPAKPARRNVLGPELRCSLQDGTAAVSGRGHSAAPGFAAWVAEKGVHHESRACPSQQTVQTAAYGANRRHHPGKIASSGMVYNPFNKE